MKFRELKLRKDPDCPVCGTHPTVTALIDYEQFSWCLGAARRGADGCRERIGQQGDHRPRAEGEDGSRRGRVRAATFASRTSMRDQPDPRFGPDPAGRSAAAVHGSSTPTARSSASASRACAARAQPRSCATTASRRRRTSKGGVLAWVDQVDPSQPSYLPTWLRAGIVGLPHSVCSGRRAQHP